MSEKQKQLKQTLFFRRLTFSVCQTLSSNRYGCLFAAVKNSSFFTFVSKNLICHTFQSNDLTRPQALESIANTTLQLEIDALAWVDAIPSFITT